MLLDEANARHRYFLTSFARPVGAMQVGIEDSWDDRLQFAPAGLDGVDRWRSQDLSCVRVYRIACVLLDLTSTIYRRSQVAAALSNNLIRYTGSLIHRTTVLPQFRSRISAR